jgi:hypothetical protein
LAGLHRPSVRSIAVRRRLRSAVHKVCFANALIFRSIVHALLTTPFDGLPSEPVTSVVRKNYGQVPDSAEIFWNAALEGAYRQERSAPRPYLEDGELSWTAEGTCVPQGDHIPNDSPRLIDDERGPTPPDVPCRPTEPAGTAAALVVPIDGCRPPLRTPRHAAGELHVSEGHHVNAAAADATVVPQGCGASRGSAPGSVDPPPKLPPPLLRRILADRLQLLGRYQK